MSVYVDPLFEWHTGRHWCHMIADSEAELHMFARRIGLKSDWFHVSSSGVPHYDLSPNKRNMAIAYGAQEITGKELVEISRRNRLRLSQNVAPFPEMDDYGGDE